MVWQVNACELKLYVDVILRLEQDFFQLEQTVGMIKVIFFAGL